nr:hypothetical protein [Tanacetum cinerariifolium]
MAKTINGEARLHAKVDGKKIIVTESSVRRDLRLADEEGIECISNSTIFEQIALMRQERRIDAINANEDITMVSVQDDVDKEMFDVDTLVGDEVFVAWKNENVVKEVVDAAQVSTAATTITITTKEISLAQALEALKTSKPNVKGIVFQEPDEEEVAIDAIPLAFKSPRIVDWKIHKEGKKSYYQIVRADGKSRMYMIFSQILKSFNRKDLEDLYKLVKARYGSTRRVESMYYLLWSDMKIMFEPHVEDEIWKMQQGYKVLEWKLYDSCRVHSLMMQSMQIYMLVEKKYPLTPPTLSMMLEKKLIINYEIYADLHVDREEVSSYTTYTFNDAGKEASN